MKTIRRYFLLFLISLNYFIPVFSQIDIGDDMTICLGEQVTLEANIEIYTEEYNPIYFTHHDSVLNQIFNIPFTFKFFESDVIQFVIAPNGWISFDINLAGIFDNWLVTSIPNPISFVPKNAIMFPWQDWYPHVDDGSFIGWAVVGTAPWRRVIIDFFNTKLIGASFPDERGTFQVIFFETSNNIECHLTNKPSAGLYLNNIATLGLHDSQGERGITPPGRNGFSWIAKHESWRFSKTGISSSPYLVESIEFNPELIGEVGNVKWYKNSLDNFIFAGNTLLVAPAQTTSYIAEICHNNLIQYRDTITVFVNPLPLANAGNDTLILQGDIVTLHGSATGGAGDYSYSWSPPEMLIDPSIQEPTTIPLIFSQIFGLQVSDVNGCISKLDEMVVCIDNGSLFAKLTINKDIICEGDTVDRQQKVHQ